MPHHAPQSHPQSAGQNPPGESVEVALGHLRKRLRASGPLASGDDSTAREWRVLRGLCEERGCVEAFDPAAWVGAPEGSEHIFEGSEHVCRFLPAEGRWEKTTKPDSAGWWVDVEAWQCLPASPLQYLERMALANRVLGDDVRFLGLYVGPKPHTCRLRISQPHVEGDSPSSEDLVAGLTRAGFREVKRAKIGAYDAMSFRQRDVWLFDVRPMNFKLYGTQFFAVDVIVQRTPRRRR